MKVLFIIPTHENNDCLIDTIENVKKFNPDITPYFVIYKSPFFKDFDQERLKSYDNLIVTKDLRQHFGYKFESQFESLIKSYTIAKEHFDFDYVQVFHTSQLFVKYGYCDYIKNYDYSSHDDFGMPPWYADVIRTELFKNVFSDDGQRYKYHMVECGFYSKFVFDYIESTTNILTLDLPSITNKFNHTPVEEVIIPTLAWNCDNINNLKKGKNTLKQIDVSMPLPEIEPNIFTIKSIPRDINHPIRKYYRDL